MSDTELEIQLLVAKFADKHGLSDIEDGDTTPYNSQFNVMEEEFDEVRDALAGFVSLELQDKKMNDEWVSDKEANLAEELADLRYTVDLMAAMVGIDIAEAEEAKARYNLEKGKEKNEDGKVVDDAGVEKPDFKNFVYRE